MLPDYQSKVFAPPDVLADGDVVRLGTFKCLEFA